MHLPRRILCSDRGSSRCCDQDFVGSRRGLNLLTAKGFTLIEVMIVLALIAILSSIAMPSLRGFAASTRLKSTAHAIRDMLNFARDMAITERAAYLVVFDLTANRYWLASNETFNLGALSTPVTASPSSSLPAQQPTTGQGTTPLQQTSPSRTNAILGIPQRLGHNVSLVHMITNHNFQTIEIDTGVDYIYFSPTGSSEDTVLYIQDQRGKSMSITVENATGRARIQQINAKQLETLGLAHESSQ